MKTPSGRFVLRISPRIHERIRTEARRRGLSLNEYCARLLERSVQGPHGEHWGVWDAVVDTIRQAFGDAIRGIVLFGSTARNEATEESDIDLLIVLADGAAPDRSMYDQWDAQAGPALRDLVARPITPHFVRLPREVLDAGGLWYEVAVDGVLLWEEDGAVSDFLRAVRAAMAEGRIRRKAVHGHPYWVKDGDAQPITR